MNYKDCNFAAVFEEYLVGSINNKVTCDRSSERSNLIIPNVQSSLISCHICICRIDKK